MGFWKRLRGVFRRRGGASSPPAHADTLPHPPTFDELIARAQAMAHDGMTHACATQHKERCATCAKYTGDRVALSAILATASVAVACSVLLTPPSWWEYIPALVPVFSMAAAMICATRVWLITSEKVSESRRVLAKIAAWIFGWNLGLFTVLCAGTFALGDILLHRLRHHWWPRAKMWMDDPRNYCSTCGWTHEPADHVGFQERVPEAERNTSLALALHEIVPAYLAREIEREQARFIGDHSPYRQLLDRIVTAKENSERVLEQINARIAAAVHDEQPVRQYLTTTRDALAQRVTAHEESRARLEQYAARVGAFFAECEAQVTRIAEPLRDRDLLLEAQALLDEGDQLDIEVRDLVKKETDALYERIGAMRDRLRALAGDARVATALSAPECSDPHANVRMLEDAIRAFEEVEVTPAVGGVRHVSPPLPEGEPEGVGSDTRASRNPAQPQRT